MDRRILEIREGLAPKYGDDFDFYDVEAKRLWSPEEDEWDVFVRWAGKFYEWEAFDKDERDYKLEIAVRLGKAKDALFGGDEQWTKRLKEAFRSPNNLVHFRQSGPFLQWCETGEDAAAQALRALWDEPSPILERVRGFSKLLPREVLSGRGGRLALASVLCLADDPLDNPVYRWEPISKAQKLLGYPEPSEDLDEAGLYEHSVEFLDRFAEEANFRGLELRDRLDAQSLIWCVSKWSADEEPVSTWAKRERTAFLKYRGEPVEDDQEDEDDEGPPKEGAETGDLAVLAKELHLDHGYLSRWDTLLKDKRQVIFYGPPGTGKTFVARRLARLYGEGSGGSSLLVQFHPSECE